MDQPTRTARRSIVLIGLLAAGLAACSSATPSSSPSPAHVASAAPTDAGSLAPSAAGTPAPTPIPVASGTPLGDRLVATLTVDTAPCAMVADETAVWITGSADGLVDRIDPATNSIVATATTGGAPCGIAIGADGRVWVAVLGTGEVVAIDRATNAVTDRITGVGPALWDLKAGFDAIWVSDRNAKQILRIDPVTAAIVHRIDVGPKPAGLAVLADGVWLADEVDGLLRRIDPSTNEVAGTIAASGTPTWFSDDGAGVLLVAERGLSRVRIVDRAGATLTNPTKGWREPLDGTVFAGRAWIPDGGARRLGVIDLAAPDAEPLRYALPGAVNPFVAEPAFGDIWVLDFSGTTVWRIRP